MRGSAPPVAGRSRAEGRPIYRPRRCPSIKVTRARVLLALKDRIIVTRSIEDVEFVLVGPGLFFYGPRELHGLLDRHQKSSRPCWMRMGGIRGCTYVIGLASRAISGISVMRPPRYLDSGDSASL